MERTGTETERAGTEKISSLFGSRYQGIEITEESSVSTLK
jgi:hypothetical protein